MKQVALGVPTKLLSQMDAFVTSAHTSAERAMDFVGKNPYPEQSFASFTCATKINALVFYKSLRHYVFD